MATSILASAGALLEPIGRYLEAHPNVAYGLAEGGGALVQSGVDLYSARQDRQERKDRLTAEAEKTKELLEAESKLASQERKEVFGLEKERTQEMLDKELKYVGSLADKNIELFNRYYDNLAKRRQELLAQGLTREEIPDFFNTILASRGNMLAQASKVPDMYGKMDYGGLDAMRSARLNQIGSAFTPLNQMASLQRRDNIGGGIRNFAYAYLQSQQGKEQRKKSLLQQQQGESRMRRGSNANPQIAPLSQYFTPDWEKLVEKKEKKEKEKKEKKKKGKKKKSQEPVELVIDPKTGELVEKEKPRGRSREGRKLEFLTPVAPSTKYASPQTVSTGGSRGSRESSGSRSISRVRGVGGNVYGFE